MRVEDILVVGGGISGMAAAIALAQAGHKVELVEQDADWRVLGAGLTVLGSTLRALEHLGVVDAVMTEGYFANGNNIYRYTGDLLFQRTGMQMPDSDLPGSGGILRPALHRILSKRVVELGVKVRLGIGHETIETVDDGVAATFSDGSQRRYTLAVVAEGLQSVTRKRLFPDAEAPAFTGQGCWRLVADRPDEVDRGSFYVGGPVTVGTVPVSQQQMYVWVLENVPDNPWVDPATQHLRLAKLLEPFGGAVGRLRDALRPDSTIVYRPLEAMLLPAPWYRGRILLIGDSAHATTPHLASGAGMGIEDGVVIAQELAAAVSMDAALERFMQRRFERCRLVVESSLEIGRAEMAHETSRITEIMNAAQSEIARPF